MKKELMLKHRSLYSHKGENGRVMLLGGSVEYVGAVMLAGMAAFRSGVDLVVIAAPQKIAWAINTFSPDFITKKFAGNYFTMRHAKKATSMAKDFDAVLIGNGLGVKKETLNFSKSVIKNIKNNKVIDADAIKAMNLKTTKNSIITPHSKELEIMLENNKISVNKFKKIKINNYKEKAKFIKNNLKSFLSNNNVILLKGNVDIIINKNKTYYNKTGNPGMSVGGTGDVLAGMCAGLLAQTKDLFKSACIAAHVNGRIGDELFKKKGYGFIASEMLDHIPKELMKHYKQR
jgi:NAD(P)H-hydrate epimerase